MSDTDPYTKIPNAILDHMAELGNAELRVLLAIVRRTAGWQKECDVISARQLAKTTGLTLRNTHAAIHALTDRGFIERRPVGKQTFCYSLKPLPVGIQLDRIPSDTGTLGDTVPLPVGIQLEEKPYPLGYQQKKDLKKDLKKERGAPAQVNIDSLHEGVTTYKRLTGKRTVPPTVAAQIADTVTDIPQWEKVVTAWCGKYRAENVSGMLDWYAHPERMEQRNGTHPHTKGTRRAGEAVDRRSELDAYLASIPNYDETDLS